LLLTEETRLCARAAQEALTARDLQSRLAAEHGKQVSVAVIKAAWVRKGFVWKRSRYRLRTKRNEVAFRKAWAEIREMIETLRPPTKDDDDRNGGGDDDGSGERPRGTRDDPPPLVMAYVDEAGFDPTQPHRRGGTPVGDVHSLIAGRGKRLNVWAARLSTNELFSVKRWRTTTALLFAGFLGLLLTHVGGPLLVILDNASLHKAKETSGLLEVLKENGLVLYFLPPYSPELNRIERFWHKMKYEWMAFKHRTTEALEAAVDKALAGFGIEYPFTF
jgi:transposase